MQQQYFSPVPAAKPAALNLVPSVIKADFAAAIGAKGGGRGI